jgi:hypothetical protein
MRVDLPTMTTISFIEQIDEDYNGVINRLGVYIDTTLNPTKVSLFFKSLIRFGVPSSFYSCITSYSYTSSSVDTSSGNCYQLSSMIFTSSDHFIQGNQ